MQHDPRTRPVPPELEQLVRDCVERRGVNGAARALGISRTTVTSVLARLQVTSGTLALLREAARRRALAGAPPLPMASGFGRGGTF